MEGCLCGRWCPAGSLQQISCPMDFDRSFLLTTVAPPSIPSPSIFGRFVLQPQIGNKLTAKIKPLSSWEGDE